MGQPLMITYGGSPAPPPNGQQVYMNPNIPVGYQPGTPQYNGMNGYSSF